MKAESSSFSQLVEVCAPKNSLGSFLSTNSCVRHLFRCFKRKQITILALIPTRHASSEQ